MGCMGVNATGDASRQYFDSRGQRKPYTQKFVKLVVGQTDFSSVYGTTFTQTTIMGLTVGCPLLFGNLIGPYIDRAQYGV